MRVSEDVVKYFKCMAEEAGIPYQTLINLYLRDCLAQQRKLQIRWPQRCLIAGFATKLQTK